jgi:hypothetical protein
MRDFSEYIVSLALVGAALVITYFLFAEMLVDMITLLFGKLP